MFGKPMALFTTLALCAGCASVPVPIRTDIPTAPLPQKFAGYYDYNPAPLRITQVEKEEIRSGYRLKRFTLAPDNSPKRFRPIKVDWYKPDKPGRLPVVLMSPILAGNDLYVKEFGRFFAARGLHAILVYRQKEVFSAGRQLEDIETHLKDSIIKMRQALDWIQTQESVDPQRIGAFSISLGAILTTILTAVEPRVRCAVLGLPAGHIPEIIMTSDDKAIRKRRRNYLKENNLTEAQALARLKEVIRSEPLDAAPAIDPRKVLIITGYFDRVLGRDNAFELWRAMRRPRMIVLPTGHYTAYFATPYLKLAVYSFLKRNLK
ncbi:MAG: hypothetical protein NC910_03485 [Candidatus Omnitrophica bacterium]|nr:hypothetical protein [Candidatus Omnitrophota bacterium]